MKISIRDERGQAVIEYILVLVVAIAIIFGGLYQLNTAFKSWAVNYFGDYLACLLETGELPTIGGGGAAGGGSSGGDGNVCNTLFKPFTFAEGRRLAAVAPTEGGGGPSGSASGSSERDSNRTRSAGGGGGSNGTPFTAGKNFGKGKGEGTAPGSKKIENTAGEGGSQMANYGPIGGQNRGYSRQTPSRIKLDQRLLGDEGRDRTARQTSGMSRAPTEAGQVKPPLKVHYSKIQAAGTDAANTGLTIADFIRFLIIAGIVIALVLFLGGQLLQIGKSMD